MCDSRKGIGLHHTVHLYGLLAITMKAPVGRKL